MEMVCWARVIVYVRMDGCYGDELSLCLQRPGVQSGRGARDC